MKTIIETKEKVIHPKYRLGRPRRVIDVRTIQLRWILIIENIKKKITAIPTITFPFDVDSQYPFMVDNNMYGNDIHGDCVKAGRAHHTLRLAAFQQGILIPITTAEVESDYFLETGGPDNGLDMLTSLNDWRQNGWNVAGEHYTIYAFAEINLSNQTEIEAALFLFNGIYAGVNLPISAQNQTGPNLIWDVSDGPDGQPGSWGGHCTYIVALNTTGPVCITWGARQQMTWAFWLKYYDEAYAVIDNIDSWVNPATDPLNIALLQQYLADIGATPSNQITVSTLKLPAGKVGKPYTAALAAAGGVLPYTWSIQSNQLPKGLNFAPSGQITGVPLAVGRSGNITFICTDADGNATGIILTITIKGKCIFS